MNTSDRRLLWHRVSSGLGGWSSRSRDGEAHWRRAGGRWRDDEPCRSNRRLRWQGDHGHGQYRGQHRADAAYAYRAVLAGNRRALLPTRATADVANRRQVHARHIRHARTGTKLGHQRQQHREHPDQTEPARQHPSVFCRFCAGWVERPRRVRSSGPPAVAASLLLVCCQSRIAGRRRRRWQGR
jgi:hypothetical protein